MGRSAGSSETAKYTGRALEDDDRPAPLANFAPFPDEATEVVEGDPFLTGDFPALLGHCGSLLQCPLWPHFLHVVFALRAEIRALRSSIKSSPQTSYLLPGWAPTKPAWPLPLACCLR